MVILLLSKLTQEQSNTVMNNTLLANAANNTLCFQAVVGFLKEIINSTADCLLHIHFCPKENISTRGLKVST